MRYILNGITHFDFFNELENYFSEIIKLLEIESINSENLKEETNQLIKLTEEHITKFIQPSSDDFLDLIIKTYNSIFDYDYSTYGFEKEPEIKKEIERLDKFRKSLRQTIAYLNMTESLINPENSIKIDSISDKYDFILLKLNSVFGNEDYSIEKILNFNDIKYRDNETREIAEDLFKSGYVILKDRYGNSDLVKISVKGAKYIERKLKIKKTTESKTELDRKIDTIIDHLKKLGFGQEIIFDEINELRDLQNKLSKTSWSQLLKGKLLDLAIDKIISVEVAKSVFEYLTNNNFKLLK
jgi:hypothetical protein